MQDDAPETPAQPEQAQPEQGRSDEGEALEVRPEPAARTLERTRKIRRRRRLFHFSFWPVLITLIISAVLIVASMAATGRVIRLPDWVAEKVEARFNRELPSGKLSVSRVELGFSPEGTPRLTLVDLSLKDETGLEIARLFKVRTGLRIGAALRGQFEPSSLLISGTEITLRRRRDGTFDLKLGTSGAATGNLGSVLDSIDAMFARPPLAGIGSVTAEALTITLEDARAGRVWQVAGGKLEIQPDDREIDIRVNFDLFNQTDNLAQVQMGFRTDRTSQKATISAEFSNATAADIAAQSPLLAFLSVLDAPISGSLRSTLDENGNLSELAGTLTLGPGALSPAAGARPVKFETAKVYVDYDPERDRLDFTSFNARSELGEVSGAGHLYLRNYRNGWPGTFLGQMEISEATIRAGDLFENDVKIEGGSADFRLHLTPFTLELGQVVLIQGGTRLQVSGEVSADSDGWRLALDGAVPRVGYEQALALWPLALAPKARQWVRENVSAGELAGLNASVRVAPDQPRRLSVESGTSGLRVRVVRAMAPAEDLSGYITINDRSLMAVAESGYIPAPKGGKVSVAGTVFSIENMEVRPTPARVDLRYSAPLTALLSLLDAKPYQVFRTTEFGPDVATGQVEGRGQVAFEMKPTLTPDEVKFSASATVTGVRSDQIVPGKVLTADRARVEVNNTRLEISGSAMVGRARGSGTWVAPIGPAANGTSRLEASLVLNQDLLDEFDIALPPGTLSGEGTAAFILDLNKGHRPAYLITSDLDQVTISVPDIGWSKPPEATGSLRIEGHLDTPVTVERLELKAPGLEAAGHLTLRADGGFGEAQFDRVRLNNWLDAPVTVTGRGPNRAVAIMVRGGTADLRRASFGEGSDSGSYEGDAPVTLTLDRLIVSEGITLTTFSADLDRKNGMQGTFRALVNGGPSINGVVAPQENGTAFRIRSKDAGGVLKAAGVYGSGRGGEMNLILAPHAGEGVYDGQLNIKQIRSVRAPALVGLLSAVSVIGLLEQVDQEGILFQEVEARFRLTPDKVIIQKGSAIGASLGVSMDGTYTLGSSEMDLAGVISPIYILNGIGQIFTRKGEGLIGFTYTLKGTPDDPKVSVNPLSIFTPAMFRELFRRPPPKIQE